MLTSIIAVVSDAQSRREGGDSIGRLTGEDTKVAHTKTMALLLHGAKMLLNNSGSIQWQLKHARIARKLTLASTGQSSYNYKLILIQALQQSHITYLNHHLHLHHLRHHHLHRLRHHCPVEHSIQYRGRQPMKSCSDNNY
jgi:hypothetical protein